MKLWPYIQGNCKGKEAHEIEKEAMKDPFLADALAGYETRRGNLQKEVAKLQKEINKRQKRTAGKTPKKKGNALKTGSITASALLIAAAVAWYFLVEKENTQHTPPAIKNEMKAISTPVKEVVEEPVEEAIKEPAKETVREPAKEPANEPAEGIPASTEQPEIAVTEQEKMKETVQTDTITSPNPQSVVGDKGFQGYLDRNLTYPTDGECRDVKGPVVVTFKVGQSGRPYNIKVSEGLCPSINDEAIRLIINGPDWKKGTQTDVVVITINF